jgi:uncharacterized membrane protein YqiK
MTQYEKIKVIILILATVLFTIVFYLHSLNGRYLIHPNKAIIIDTRTGDVYNAKDRTKIN